MALSHFPALLLFSFFVSLAFAALGRQTTRERVIYGVKVFAAFVGFAVVLGLVMYFVP